MKTRSDEILICRSDLKRLFHKTWRKVKNAAFIGATAAFLFFLTTEPRYVAEATFKQGADTHETGSLLKELFQTMGTSSSQETSTLALMHSRAVMRDAVEELGLQVVWDRHLRITRFLGRIWENVGLELGCRLSEVEEFAFRKVQYDGEKAKTLFIQMVDENHFKLWDKDHRELGQWALHEKIALPDFSGYLAQVPSYIGKNKTYRLKILPWADIRSKVRKRFVVKQQRLERKLYTLTFAHRNRHVAADFLNQVMRSCQRVIHNENEEIAAQQLAYLESRQEELAHKWDGSLQEHVAYLKDNLSDGGYLSFSQEVNSLQTPQNAYATRLLDIDFELKRLKSQDMDEKSPSSQRELLDRNKAMLHVATVKNEIPLVLEQQKQKIDEKLSALELEERRLEEEATPLSASGMLHEVASLAQQQREATQILERLEKGEEFPLAESLCQDPKSLVAIWAKQIAAQQKLCANNPSLPKEKEQLKAFIEQTATKIGLLEENIAVQASTVNEFAGLTLDTAQHLYLEYNNQRDHLQAQLKQLIYLSEQLYQPHFELSSITTILSDPVTQGLVLQAGETTVKLQDADNRSLREQEHLKQTLHTQKAFLSQHLLQIIELTKLRARLAEEKIRSLRKTTLGLLKHEKDLLGQQLDQISRKMEDLPEKWRRENLLLLKKELGMKMVEGLAQLMESKSIDRHLYKVGSKPLDLALTPIKPKKPYLLLFALVGGVLGGVGSYFFYLSRSLVRGLPVSHETLTLSGFNSCGALSSYCNAPIGQLSHTDLETLRRLVQFLIQLDQKGICCPIIGGKNSDFSSSLAQLLSMQQRRTLVINYVFDKPVHPNDTPGLWHYLHAETPTCPVRHELSFDFLPSGGTSRHAVELLSNPKLTAFLASAKSRYDVILVQSSAQAADVEGQALLNIADAAIVAVNEERKEDLFIYEAWNVLKQPQRVAFVDMHKNQ